MRLLFSHALLLSLLTITPLAAGVEFEPADKAGRLRILDRDAQAKQRDYEKRSHSSYFEWDIMEEKEESVKPAAYQEGGLSLENGKQRIVLLNSAFPHSFR